VSGAPESGLAAISAPQPSSGPTSGFPRVDKYELLEEIGHGGMATVYRARDPRLGREVAVKVIHKHLRENPEVGTRFVAEARAAAKLRHPGIVEVFDVSSEEDAERYLVVELIRGTTLRKVLQKHRDMPAEIGAAIVLQICGALEHAHESAIIHRDIKPENVLVELPADRAAANARLATEVTPAPISASTVSEVRAATIESSIHDTQVSPADALTPAPVRDAATSSPRSRAPSARSAKDDSGVIIKITDFGIAKILDAAGVTSTGQVLGSPAHMAPEQIEGGEVDARTDVFALGVLLYECLVGHLPFEGKNPAQVLRRVLEGTYPAADRERPEAGGRWSRIVARALARDASERTASAAELGEAIAAELSALGIDQPKAEVDAYFADPEGYAKALPDRLVPRLATRGEAARKARDVPGAAADFNRALALRPGDAAILKRLAKLTSSAGRRRLLRRAAAIAVSSAVLGLLAFGAARALKKPPARLDAPTSQSAAVDGSARPTDPRRAPSGEPSALAPPLAPVPSAEPQAKRPRVPATPTVITSAQPAALGTRMVRFNVDPKGAKLTVDGVGKSSFYAFPLAVGPHQVDVAPLLDSCCKKISTTVTVLAPGAEDPQNVQEIPLSMEIKPATVTLSGAPPNGQLSCPRIGLTCYSGASAQVKLREPVWKGPCQFQSPEKQAKQQRVTINAGEVNPIPWPAD
jgi:serine/threonine-protein kinase